MIETPVSNNPYLGAMSDPWHMSEPQLCQKQLCSVRVLSTSLGSSSHGVGLSHSVKAILRGGGRKRSCGLELGSINAGGDFSEVFCGEASCVF